MTFLFWTAIIWLVLAVILLIVLALQWFEKPDVASEWRTTDEEHDRIIEQLATHYPSMSRVVRADFQRRGNGR